MMRPGVPHVVERLRALPVALIVLEATGGLELPLIGSLVAAGVPVVGANPRQVRDFANDKSKGSDLFLYSTSENYRKWCRDQADANVFR